MKIFVMSAAIAAIAATSITTLGGAIAPTASSPQFEAAEINLVSRGYVYRGTGRRQILS